MMDRVPTQALATAEHDWPARHAIFSGGNKVELLRGGAELFPAMCAAIDRAEREIALASYIFNDDPAAGKVLDALCAAARRGVRLRIGVDGFGSIDTLGTLRSRFAGVG